MTTNITRAAPRLLTHSGAILLISASAALGAYYGYSIGSHAHVLIGFVFAGAGLGGEILKPFAVLGAFDSFQDRKWLRGLACLALGFICVIYNLAAELSLAAGSRGHISNSRHADAAAVARAKSAHELALSELHSLAPTRAAAELAPVIEKLRATPGANRCEKAPDGPVSRRVCGKVLDLQAEAARAKRRRVLEKQISKASTYLQQTERGLKPADPLANTLSAYAASTGADIEPEKITPWLALIPVFFLEFGSALALVVARQVKSVEPTPETGHALDRPIRGVGGGASCPRITEGEKEMPSAPESPIITLLNSNGGKMSGGQREMARKLGISKSRVNKLLHQHANEGRVHLDTGHRGTTVRLTAG